MKKYVIPNITYLFIGWVFLKVGTAYRLAAGANLLSQNTGIGQTLGPVPIRPPEEKPLDKVREIPPKRRSREREER